MISPTAPSSSIPATAGDLVWHHAEAVDVLRHLSVTTEGLAPDEAARRLARHGPNVIERGAVESRWRMLWRQIHNPLVHVLIGAAVLAIATGKMIDGLVVLGVVLANAVIGFLQEMRASDALAALTKLVPETATVVRAGGRLTLDASILVPGDVIALQSGDKVPADARLLEVKSLRVEEAALTGESVPAEKHTDALPVDAALGDRRNVVFGGTLVTYGTALAVVVGTGAGTELGRISSMLSGTTSVETPLTRQLAGVGRWLTIGIVAVAVVLFVVAVVRGYGWSDALLAAITLAVAAIPEGLPAIITIALAVGVQRMARRRAVIRHLPAVETLGSTTVICSDKTGTLTRNEMTVQALWPGDGTLYEVSGVGYAPIGKVQLAGVALPVLPEDVRRLLVAGALCNDASLRLEDGAWRLTGDPTEAALVTAAAKGQIPAEALRSEQPRLDVVPFESERQFMATLHATPDDANAVFVKGAPEVVLARTAVRPAGVDAAIDDMARRGMRVLALAGKAMPASHRELSEGDLTALTFYGLQGMIDPPREEAIAAIENFRRAGITVKMITGDHPATASAIGRELGLTQGEVLTGRELDRLAGEGAGETIARVNVFARVAPEHKLRLVRALQSRGEVVAMTGDGVNDAPAVKQADVGIAMGITGTAVSKEAAKVVLVDDNFATIAAAVEEGRRIYDNLIKALAFVLPTNLGQALVILLAAIFFPIIDGQPLLPMLPVHILWINLVATVALALPLAFEAAEPDVMRRPPRSPSAPVFSRFLIVRTVLVGILMALGAIGLFLLEYTGERRLGVSPELALREAHTMAVTTMIFFQIFYLLNCRSLRDSIFTIGLWSNPIVYLGIGALLVLQAGFVYLPFAHTLFGTASLPLEAWAKAVAAALIVLPAISLEKWLRRRSRATVS